MALNINITATFSKAMDPATITGTNFTVVNTTLGGTPVAGTVTLAASGTTAVFTPASNLAANTIYTATITTEVTDLAIPANSLATNFVLDLYNRHSGNARPGAGNSWNGRQFWIPAKTAISTIPPSVITGDIGVSPAAATFITGFSLTADPTNVFSTSSQVIGKVYAANFAVPTPSNLTTAVSDMETAYTNAAGRAPTTGFSELFAGNLSGKTLLPGCYKWSTGVLINTDVTLNGGPNDVWIFQIAGNLTQANATRVILTGGALPKNIFWQVAGGTGGPWNDRALRGSNTGAKRDHGEYRRIDQRQTVGTDCSNLRFEYRYTACPVRHAVSRLKAGQVKGRQAIRPVSSRK